jgi:hypothetical protein
MKMPSETVMNAQIGGNDLHAELEAEANGQKGAVEEDAREAEREVMTHAKQHKDAPAGLYDVLNAAGVLMANAKECLAAAPAKSTLRTSLRSVVESATEIMETMTECIKQTQIDGNAGPADPKSQK